MAKESFEKYSTTIWRSLIITVFLFLGAWAFYAIAGMPEKYVSKQDYNREQTTFRENIKEIKENIKDFKKVTNDDLKEIGRDIKEILKGMD